MRSYYFCSDRKRYNYLYELKIKKQADADKTDTLNSNELVNFQSMNQTRN